MVSVADDLVEIKTAAGEVIPFEGRPLSFALEQGFSLEGGGCGGAGRLRRGR